MQELRDAFDVARQEAMSSFASDRMLLERFIERPRHIEMQVPFLPTPAVLFPQGMLRRSEEPLIILKNFARVKS
jgi:hypothetical protein